MWQQRESRGACELVRAVSKPPRLFTVLALKFSAANSARQMIHYDPRLRFNTAWNLLRLGFGLHSANGPEDELDDAKVALSRLIHRLMNDDFCLGHVDQTSGP
jgi:hypothetical protein